MTTLTRFSTFIAAILMIIASPAFAQAPINSDVALQPSEHHLIIRQQFRYFEASDDPSPLDREIKTLVAPTTFVYGLSSELTLIANVPTVYREIDFGATGDTREDFGVADFTTLAKLRLFRDDFGPTDTTRFDLLGGLEIRSGDSDFTSDSYDPIIGGVASHIVGRHAFSADALWTFNTGGGARSTDRLKYDAAWVYRLTPEAYQTANPTALNSVLELNGFYETNGDNELFISPGIQFVTQRYILEATVQIPIWQDLDNRPATDFVVGVGVRFQF